MVELVNNIDNLEFIIAKAREYDVQVPAVDEESGPMPATTVKLTFSTLHWQILPARSFCRHTISEH